MKIGQIKKLMINLGRKNQIQKNIKASNNLDRINSLKKNSFNN